jgi:hypothetical protein
VKGARFGRNVRPFWTITEATEVSVRRAPGFVSASLHRSTDGTKATMVCTMAELRRLSGDASGSCPRFRFFRKRSRSPSLNPASTKSCEPSHPPASRIEATTVLSALRPQAVARRLTSPVCFAYQCSMLAISRLTAAGFLMVGYSGYRAIKVCQPRLCRTDPAGSIRL